jgi:hypothetical protein
MSVKEVEQKLLLDGTALEDPPINASPVLLRELEKMIAWQDIKRRLVYSIVSKRNTLETLGEEQEGDALALVGTIAHLQGELFQLRTLLDLPERLAIQKEMESENEHQ